MKRIMLWLLISCCLAVIGYSQARRTKKPPASKPATQIAPILPTEIQFTYYKLKEPSAILTIRNLDKTRSVTKVVCFISSVDPIKLEMQQRELKNFEFAVPVAPGETGKAIVQVSEKGFYPGRCLDYTGSKSDSRVIFTPDRCTQDAFLLSLGVVVFEDDTQWPPKPPKTPKQLAEETKYITVRGDELKRKLFSSSDISPWPFSLFSADLGVHCEKNAVYLFVGGSPYALNGTAAGTKLDGFSVSTNINALKGNLPTEEFNKGVMALIARAQQLCSE